MNIYGETEIRLFSITEKNQTNFFFPQKKINSFLTRFCFDELECYQQQQQQKIQSLDLNF